MPKRVAYREASSLARLDVSGLECIVDCDEKMHLNKVDSSSVASCRGGGL